jgi:hypothetical protein
MKYILFVIALLFGGCSVKEYEHTQTKVITIKSPKIKFSDVGYIRNSAKSIELELFIAGKSIEKFSIDTFICTTKEGCMSKGSFNADYLNSVYPDDILQNILLSGAIYGGKNLQKEPEGFVQNIKDENVDITYMVDASGTYFKDRKNGIIFSIKEADE